MIIIVEKRGIMITVSILGLDPYLVRQISKDLTPRLSDIYECHKDDVDFYAPECLFIHDGVEQNTWNVLVRVHAPLKVKVMEKEVARIIHEFMKDACINLAIEFYYYSQDNRYEFIDPTHPRFMTEENSVEIDQDDSLEEDLRDERDDEDYEEPYLGNVFEDFEKKLNGGK